MKRYDVKSLPDGRIYVYKAGTYFPILSLSPEESDALTEQLSQMNESLKGTLS